MIYFLLGVLIFTAVVLIGVMIWDSNRFVTAAYRIPCQGLKRKYRFVMLSDLHNKQYGAHNTGLLAAIEAQKPESILIAGDMLTSQKPGVCLPARELVEKLAERYPVYYGIGNHEQRMMENTECYGDSFRIYREYLEERGVIFLENKSVILPDPGIRICGIQIDRKFYRKFRKYPMDPGYLDRLAGKPSDDLYQILLAHNPDYFPEYAQWGADLVLSGHVHGGIMRLPFLGGVLSPAMRLFPRYDGGLFQENGSRMILGRGLGSHTIPVRIFNPGELVTVCLLPDGGCDGD